MMFNELNTIIKERISKDTEQKIFCIEQSDSQMDCENYRMLFQLIERSSIKIELQNDIKQTEKSICLSGKFVDEDVQIFGFPVGDQVSFIAWENEFGEIHFRLSIVMQPISLGDLTKQMIKRELLIPGRLSEIDQMLNFKFTTNVVLEVDSEERHLLLGVDQSPNSWEVLQQIGLNLSKLGFWFIITVDGNFDFYINSEIVLGEEKIIVDINPPIDSFFAPNNWLMTISEPFKPALAINFLVEFLSKSGLGKTLGINELSKYFPSDLYKLNFWIDKFKILFEPTSTKIGYILFELVSRDTWKISDFLELQNVVIEMYIPFNPSPSIFTKIFGTVKLDEFSDINVNVFIPDSLKSDWILSLEGQIELDSFMDFAKLPGGLTVDELKLPDGFFELDELEIGVFDIKFNPADKTISEINIALKVFMECNLIPGVLRISTPYVELSVQNPFNQKELPTREVSGTIQADLEIAGLRFYLEAQKQEEGWMFSGKADGEIKVSQIIKDIFAEAGICLPSVVPDFTLTNLSLSYDSTSENYSIHGECISNWEIPLGVTTLTMDSLKVEIGKIDGKTTGIFRGKVSLGGVEMEICYDMEKGLRFEGSVPELRTRHLLETVCGSSVWGTLELPDWMPSLDFSNVHLIWNINEKDITVYGEVSGFGKAVLVTKKTDSKWGFFLGVVVGDDWRFASLDSSLSLLDTIQFNNISLNVSSFDDNNFIISDYPELSGAINRGVSFSFKLKLAEKDELSFIIKLLKLSLEDLSMHCVMARGQTIIDGALQDDINIGYGLKLQKSALRIRTTTGSISFSIYASLCLELQDPLIFTGEMSVQPNGSHFCATMQGEWNDPFSINGITISDVALDLGISAELVPTIGIAGKAKIGDFTGEMGVIINSITPQQSVLHLKYNQIGLKTIFEICDPSVLKAIPTEFDAVINSGLKNVDIHIVPQTTCIGEICYDQGFRLKGELNLFGYMVLADIDVDQTSGISAKGSMSSINLLNVFKLTGINGAPDPNVIIELNTKKLPLVHIAGLIDFMGLTRQSVYMDFSINGLKFSIKQKLYDCVDLNLCECLINDTGFTAEGEITFGIDKIGPVKVMGVTLMDSITLNTGFKTRTCIKLLMMTDGTVGFSLALIGSLNILGINLPEITVNLIVAPNDFKNLYNIVVDAIINWITGNFNKLLKDLEEWANAVKNGLISFSGNIAQVAHDVYDASMDAAIRAYKTLGRSVNEISSCLKTSYGATANEVAKALKSAGYCLNEIGAAVGTVYGLGANEVANALNAAGYGVDEVGDYLKKELNCAADTVNGALNSAGYAASEVEGYLKKNFKWPPYIDFPYVDIPYIDIIPHIDKW